MKAEKQMGIVNRSQGSCDCCGRALTHGMRVLAVRGIGRHADGDYCPTCTPMAKRDAERHGGKS